MPIIDTAQEEQLLSRRKWNNGFLALGAAAVLGAALLVFSVAQAPVVAALLGVTGVGLFIKAYNNNLGMEKDIADLKARTSSSSLIDSLKTKGVALTPEQERAIHQEEYTKTNAEWRERLAEVRQAREVGD